MSSPYVLILKGDDYLILLEHIAQGSNGHTALLGARNPTPSGNRAMICSQEVVEELLSLARRVSPEVSAEISKQIQRQKIGTPEIFSTENGSAREIAGWLGQECSADDRAAWQAGTPTVWANESLALTREFVYPLPVPSQAISTSRVEVGVVAE